MDSETVRSEIAKLTSTEMLSALGDCSLRRNLAQAKNIAQVVRPIYKSVIHEKNEYEFEVKRILMVPRMIK